ncbi:MAG TPA: N-formylglutamate amidohydrolase [Steroidobacteraceae bacterium]|nr:N-formylglutamate amidohydrolase [Steroidobacteraceae bacterium]
MTLLEPNEPPAFRVLRPHGGSPYFLTCDHAGARVPHKLGSLGVSAADMERHIAWDLGAADVAIRLSAELDAFAILQAYSRLVIDCNRRPGIPASIVRISESTRIPGNEVVTVEEAAAREREIFRPYHDRIRTELDTRQAQGRPTMLISVHSFTPRFHGNQRPWHAGVLYNRDPRLAGELLLRLRAEPGLVIGDNEPYSVGDITDYTIPEHGERRGLPHVGIELRQDLISTEAGQSEWTERLARALVSIVAPV